MHELECVGGDSLQEAFAHVVEAMFGYMTELETVDATAMREYVVEAHDMPSLLFALMDEFLFIFSTDLFIPCRVEIVEWDVQNFRIKALG